MSAPSLDRTIGIALREGFLNGWEHCQWMQRHVGSVDDTGIIAQMRAELAMLKAGVTRIAIHEDNTGLAPAAERYYAIDDATYDGAEDSKNRNMVGRGATKEAALADLLERMEDAGP
jgi:hypothetical protein